MLAAGLGLTEAGIKALQNISSKWQRPAITREGTVRMLACYKEILKEKNRFLSRQISVFASSSYLQGLVHHRQYCWSLEMMIQITGLQFKRKCLLLTV
jgi:hypothetical protein